MLKITQNIEYVFLKPVEKLLDAFNQNIHYIRISNITIYPSVLGKQNVTNTKWSTGYESNGEIKIISKLDSPDSKKLLEELEAEYQSKIVRQFISYS